MDYNLTIKKTIEGHGLPGSATIKEIATATGIKTSECAERLEMAAKDNPYVREVDGKVSRFNIYSPVVWLWLGYAFGKK